MKTVLKNIGIYAFLFLSLPDQVFCKTKKHDYNSPPNKPDIFNYIEVIENEKRIPKGLLKAVIRQESDFNPVAYLDGSYGLGQITLGTAKTYCDVPNRKILYEYRTNIKCAGKFLKILLDRYNQQKYYALAAYNIGTPFVCNGHVYKRNLGRNRIETLPKSCTKKGKVSNERYVTSVLRHWQKYRISEYSG